MKILFSFFILNHFRTGGVLVSNKFKKYITLVFGAIFKIDNIRIFCINWDLQDTSLKHQGIIKSKKHIQTAEHGSVVLLHDARVFDYFVVIEIAFMDNQAQITQTISRLDSDKVS